MISLSLRCLLFLVFSTALILAVTKTANACSCGPRPTVLDSFEGSDEVVIVKAVSVEKVQDKEERHYVNGIKTVTMVVEKIFKGKLKVRDEIVFGQGGGADCIWTFSEESVGRQFLFYLDRPEKLSFPASNDAGLWFAFTCGRVSGVENAAEDLLYLENLSKVRGKTRISGSLHSDYPQFDLLFWNGDTTNLPAKWHRAYLTQFYRENRLVQPGGIVIDGVPIDLRTVKTPTYVQAGREDHIAPPQSVWKITHHFSGPMRFVLAGSGHIAGVVNPPEAQKYQYWTNEAKVDTLDQFIAGAAEHKGSWWPDWIDWIRSHSPKTVAAKGARFPGSGKLKAIEDAPGSYVKAR